MEFDLWALAWYTAMVSLLSFCVLTFHAQQKYPCPWTVTTLRYKSCLRRRLIIDGAILCTYAVRNNATRVKFHGVSTTQVGIRGIGVMKLLVLFLSDLAGKRYVCTCLAVRVRQVPAMDIPSVIITATRHHLSPQTGPCPEPWTFQ